MKRKRAEDQKREEKIKKYEQQLNAGKISVAEFLMHMAKPSMLTFIKFRQISTIFLQMFFLSPQEKET